VVEGKGAFYIFKRQQGSAGTYASNQGDPFRQRRGRIVEYLDGTGTFSDSADVSFLLEHVEKTFGTVGTCHLEMLCNLSHGWWVSVAIEKILEKPENAFLLLGEGGFV
jgi:hypothetical protein